MATENSVPSLADKMAALEAAFKDRLPKKLSEIDGALAESLSNSADTKPLQAMHQLLHKMAGSAGTFGFVALGLRARDLEGQLDALLSEAEIDSDRYMLFGQNVKGFLGWCEEQQQGAGESILQGRFP